MRAKWRAFVDEYFRLNMNGTRAYKAVYGVEDDDVAGAAASRLLGNVRVAAEVEKRLKARQMGADEVLDRLTEMARGNHAEFMTPAGPNMSALIAAGKAHLIKKWTRTDSGVSIEFYNAKAALAILARVHGLLKDPVDHSGEIKIIVKYEDDNPETP